MKVHADWLNSSAAICVSDVLTQSGYQAWFVGGCVRNALLGAPVSDLDISTNAHPDQVMTLAKKSGLNVIPTGIDHGTVTVICEGQPFEITTFRRDVETDGRRAVVAFSDSLHEDAQRRDFTMNALYADIQGNIVDPVGGLDDLERRMFRFIGNAEDRIKEDYLRILRFFRFHAWYGHPMNGIDADGLAACAMHIEGLGTLSAERIGTEIKKLLSAPDPSPAMASFASIGGLAQVLPGADHGALAVLVHLEGDRPVDPIRRLACLGGEGVAKSLRLSNSEKRMLERIAEAGEADLGLAELGYRFPDVAEDVHLIRSAKMGTSIDPVDFDAIERGKQQVFPVKANDLMPDYSGPALGAMLRTLEDRWIVSDFTLSKEQLLSTIA